MSYKIKYANMFLLFFVLIISCEDNSSNETHFSLSLKVARQKF